MKQLISMMMRLFGRRSCEDVVAVLHDYFEGTLDPRPAKTIEKHFRDCPDCEAFSETYATLVQLTGELAREDIPDEVRCRVHEALAERSAAQKGKGSVGSI